MNRKLFLKNLMLGGIVLPATTKLILTGGWFDSWKTGAEWIKEGFEDNAVTIERLRECKRLMDEQMIEEWNSKDRMMYVRLDQLKELAQIKPNIMDVLDFRKIREYKGYKFFHG